jgi:hypothetical protein
MAAEQYVLTDPQYRFRGTVQGIGWAVNPEDQPIVAGVPQIKREPSWVHSRPTVSGPYPIVAGPIAGLFGLTFHDISELHELPVRR